MSLSNDPTFSILKDRFICGYEDIQNKQYAGKSRTHDPEGQAIETTNGAGPHNIQIFVLNENGIVLTCLPGYWNSPDLASELELARSLNKLWLDSSISRERKNAEFKRMQLGHIAEHSPEERERSRMQWFDAEYEWNRRSKLREIFYGNPIDPYTNSLDPAKIKTTDVLMHQRMAMRPFLSYKKFDVDIFSDYGDPMYDKEENYRCADGHMPVGSLQAHGDGPKLIGNDSRLHPVKDELKRQAKSLFGVQIFGMGASRR